MKKLFLLMLAAMSLGAGISLKKEDVFLTEHILERSVKIVAFKQIETPWGPVDGYGQGTGVSLGNGLILTENHVVGGSNRILVLTHGKTRFALAKVLRLTPNKDLAIIRIKDITLPAVKVSDKFKLGQRVVAVGNAGAHDFELVRARITGVGVVLISSVTARGAIQMDNTDIRHGFSGGGIFNRQGELIGMTEALGVEDAPLAIMGDELKAYLEKK